nr:MAG TPA: hypothetical protein [Bacteriophage sp.]
MAIKAYKGFKKDMTCKGFQYEEGKEYETDKAEVCETGFHACEYPLDCFKYYAPSESVFHEVEQGGEISRKGDDTKLASTKIKIGVSLNIAGMVKAAIEYTKSRTDKEADSNSNYGASSATGYKGASSATGDYGASSATGNCGASSATGYCGASSADDRDSIAVAWGYHGKAKGVIGSYLVLADWEGDEDNYWTQELWSLKGAKMVRVDGTNIKANTWYTMKNGEIVECEED